MNRRMSVSGTGRVFLWDSLLPLSLCVSPGSLLLSLFLVYNDPETPCGSDHTFHSLFISTTAQSFLFPLKKSTGGFFTSFLVQGLFFSLSLSQSFLALCVHPPNLSSFHSEPDSALPGVGGSVPTHSFFIASA